MVANAIETERLVKTCAASGNQPPKQALKGVDPTIPAGAVLQAVGAARPGIRDIRTENPIRKRRFLR